MIRCYEEDAIFKAQTDARFQTCVQQNQRDHFIPFVLSAMTIILMLYIVILLIIKLFLFMEQKWYRMRFMHALKHSQEKCCRQQLNNIYTTTTLDRMEDYTTLNTWFETQFKRYPNIRMCDIQQRIHKASVDKYHAFAELHE